MPKTYETSPPSIRKTLSAELKLMSFWALTLVTAKDDRTRAAKTFRTDLKEITFPGQHKMHRRSYIAWYDFTCRSIRCDVFCRRCPLHPATAPFGPAAFTPANLLHRRGRGTVDSFCHAGASLFADRYGLARERGAGCKPDRGSGQGSGAEAHRLRAPDALPHRPYGWCAAAGGEDSGGHIHRPRPEPRDDR